MRRILICLMAGLLLLTACASAECEITAQGSAQVQLVPDVAVVHLGVTAFDRDVASAVTQVNVRLDAVRQALKGQGIQEKDISVASLYLYAQRNYDESSGEEQVTGYNVSHEISVRTANPDRLGELIDSAVLAGANDVSGVSFMSSQWEQAYPKALEEAVRNASEHARTMAEAQNLALGDIKSMTEQKENAYMAGNGAAVFKSADELGTQVDVGAVTVSALVTVVYEAE